VIQFFFSCENGAFLLVEATVCSRFYYWSEIDVIRTKIIMQSTYTSAIERSLLNWNGRDCNDSMHYTIGFYCCHVTTFWNLIGTANFQASEVTVWTHRSHQAISSMAWEQGYTPRLLPSPLLRKRLGLYLLFTILITHSQSWYIHSHVIHEARKPNYIHDAASAQHYEIVGIPIL